MITNKLFIEHDVEGNITLGELNEENWMEHINAKLPPEDLLDAIGDVKAAIKFLEKVEGAIKEMLPTKFESEEWEFDSDTYHATRLFGARVGLDSDKIKEEMGADWVAAHSKSTEFYTLKVTRKK